MTTKTPAEIAAEIVAAEYGPGTEWDSANELGESGLHRAQMEGRVTAPELEHLIERAILADRAQRRADLDVLADAAACWSTELVDYVIPAASEAEAAEHELQCDQITAALGRYLDDAEAPRV